MEAKHIGLVKSRNLNTPLIEQNKEDWDVELIHVTTVRYMSKSFWTMQTYRLNSLHFFHQLGLGCGTSSVFLQYN